MGRGTRTQRGMCSRYRRGQAHQPAEHLFTRPTAIAVRDAGGGDRPRRCAPAPRRREKVRRRENRQRGIHRRQAVDRFADAAREARRGEGSPRCPIRSSTTRHFEEAQTGWAAPDVAEPRRRRLGDRPAAPPPPRRRSRDGPVSPWRPGLMTVARLDHGDRRAVRAAARQRRRRLDEHRTGDHRPGDRRDAGQLPRPRHGRRHRRLRRACIALYFRPQYAKFLGPVYAIAEGFFVGAISKVFEDAVERHRRPGGRRHARRVRRDARPLQHEDHQGHRQVPAHRHLRHARHHGALPGVVRDLAVRRLGAVHQRRLARSASASASSSAASRR